MIFLKKYSSIKVYKFIPHNDYDMGIESSRESASANVEKKPDIITLLKQHLPNASVESFSALKPEKQRAA